MKTLRFRYVGAWNFMPFGSDGIEIHFGDYGQVVLITGTNLDTGTPTQPASNATGKSSIQDIISYALYGKTVKRPKKLTHEMLINKQAGKKMLVEVQFDDYRVVRGRHPDKLDIWHSKDHIWDDKSRITKGSSPDTQALIEGLIGLTHTAFCNVVVFDDSNSYSFLEMDSAGKRQIVQNLMGLDFYRKCQDQAKQEVKEHKQLIRDLTRDVEHLQTSVSEAEDRIVQVGQQEKQWLAARQKELADLKRDLEAKQGELAKCDGGTVLAAYNKAQERAVELRASVQLMTTRKNKVAEALTEARGKLDEATTGLTGFETEVQEAGGEVGRLRSERVATRERLESIDSLGDGARCPTCNGKVSQANQKTLREQLMNIAHTVEAKLVQAEARKEQAALRVARRQEFIRQMRSAIAESEKKEQAAARRIAEETAEIQTLVAMPKPDVGEAARRLEAEVVALKKRAQEKHKEIDGISPYKEILEKAKADKVTKLAEKKAKGDELHAADKLRPYLEWWVDGYGDGGIRRYLVEKVIPTLNSRIAYWLQFLIDSKITVEFDSELNETITRNGVPAEYHAMSNGERRRINLAVSQAFAWVMMVNSGHCPSLVFLDEVTGGGIDSAGVTGVCNMIYELAKERQVLVTTHNQALLRLLDGCESLNLVKEGDVTRLDK